MTGKTQLLPRKVPKSEAVLPLTGQKWSRGGRFSLVPRSTQFYNASKDSLTAPIDQ
ncbi:hypothetical protein Psta_4200 [Pirellula staleyi DSM 6068]|uniref:Uncharacterized protein n=1 Tax=Pirellula staleyi (strain ATCC 27377 / DSM 6068 / ICPB 4128) TaxID=530564 RepID=D2R3Z9_PIRSD|nr:hypothetical protein Psta_4200 [Pirellula staleyi DSM 6068]